VAAARDRLVEYYHEQGYPNVTVEIVEGTKPDDGGVVYQIDDGEKVKRAL
jgi:outer membrane protein assembly factor BamA